MMRPVRHLASGGLELLGTLEQSNLDIHCPDGGSGGSPGLLFTHAETAAGAAAGPRGSGWGGRDCRAWGRKQPGARLDTPPSLCRPPRRPAPPRSPQARC
jgi:hypothetical protein